MLMVIMMGAIFGTTASAAVTTTENVGFTDIPGFVVETSTTTQKITMYLWWEINQAAKNYTDLQVKVSVAFNNGAPVYILNSTEIKANEHYSLATAFVWDQWGAMFNTSGTYVVKVEFVNLTEPSGANALDNSISKTMMVGDEFYTSFVNMIYSVLFALDKLIASTGIDFLGQIPYLSAIIIIIIIVVIYLLYRRGKRKRMRPMMPVRRTTSYRETVGTMPAYQQRRPPYQDNRDNQYYP